MDDPPAQRHRLIGGGFLQTGLRVTPQFARRAGILYRNLINRGVDLAGDIAQEYASNYISGIMSSSPMQTDGAGGGSGYRSGNRFGRGPDRASYVKGSVGRTVSKFRRAIVRKDPVVYRQLGLGLTNWCSVTNEMTARIRGTVNKAHNITYMCGKIDPYLQPLVGDGTGTSGDIAHMRQFEEAVRQCQPARIQDSLQYVRGGIASTLLWHDATPRTAWEMGTCWQMRDMLAYCYGLFDQTSVRQGYLPPYYTYNGTTTIQYRHGAPNVFASDKLAYPRAGNPGTGTSGLDDSSYVATLSSTLQPFAWQYKMKQLQQKVPMHIEYEEMLFTFSNPSETVQDVTLYELILKKDVPIVECRGNATITGIQLPVGALPDPVALWTDYMQYCDAVGHMTTVPSGHPPGAQQDGIVNEELALFAGTNPESEVAGFQAQGNSDTRETAGNPGTAPQTADSYQVAAVTPKSPSLPNVRPMGHLLDEWYKVVPHKIRLEAGSRRSLRIRVNYHGCPKWTQVMENYGTAGKTRVFMLRVQGERLFGRTSAAGAGALSLSTAYAQPDILVNMVRRNKFCRFNIRQAKHTLSLRTPMRTDLDALYQVDAEEGDIEAVTGTT